jgi:DUF1680 family protein
LIRVFDAHDDPLRRIDGGKFRVPRRCEDASAEVNGSSAGLSAKPGTWAMIARRWNEGDRLKITLPMTHVPRPVHQRHPNRVAFSYGPVVLVGRGGGCTVVSGPSVGGYVSAASA